MQETPIGVDLDPDDPQNWVPTKIFTKFYQHGVPCADQTAAIEEAATEILHYISSAANHDEEDEFMTTGLAILEFAKSTPRAIDFTLLVYARVCEQPNRHDPTQGLDDLLYEVVQPLVCVPPCRPHDVGTQHGLVYDLGPNGNLTCHGTELANVTFKRAEVDGRPQDVVSKVLNLHAVRRETVAQWAVVGRARALGLTMREPEASSSSGAWMLEWFDAIMQPRPDWPTNYSREPRMDWWSKADFAARCVALRAGASSFLNGNIAPAQRDGVLQRWKDELAMFFLEGDEAPRDENFAYRDGDFAVKYHAALLLDNLNKGPRDETSDEIFDVGKWVM